MLVTRIGLAVLLLAPAAAARAASGAEAALDDCSRLLDQGAVDEALLRCGKAVELARREGDRRVEGSATRQRGTARYRLGDYAEAMADHEQALAIAREVNDRKAEADTYNELGVVLEEQGRFEEALRYDQLALATHRSLPERSPGDEAIDLNNLATVQSDLGRYPEAIANFEEALLLAREAKDRPAESAFLQNIGACWRRLGQYRRSLEYLERSLSIRREVGDRRGEGVTLDSIGVSHARLGRHDQALAFHDRALAIFLEVKDRNNEGLSLKRGADALQNLGRHEEALERYHRAVDIMRELDDRPYAARALAGMGAALRDLGRPDEGLEAQEEALAVLREAKDLEGEQGVLHELMSTWASLGRPRLAIFRGKQAVNAAERLRAGLGALDLDARRSFAASLEATYRDLADLLLAEGRLPEAEQVLGLLKDEEYGNALEGPAGAGAAQRIALTPLEASEAERDREATETLGALGAELDLARRKRIQTAGEDHRIEALQERLAATREAFRADLLRIRKAFEPGAGSLDQVAASLDDQPVRAELRRLGPGAVALYTLCARERLHLLLVAPGRQVAREVPVSRAALARSVLAFREALQDPASDPVPLARELYHLLLAPVERDLAAAGATTVLWSLDGALRYLPVAALHDGKGWLVERYRSAVFTPASLAQRAPLPRRALSAWAFGVSRPTAGFGALPGVEAELREIVGAPGKTAGVMPGEALLDRAFTREAMIAALEGHRRPVVHLASHFRFVPGAPAESFLVTGDGGRLTLRELAGHPGLFEGVEVVSLSACETAVSGGEEGGQELEGFAALVQRLGARAVLATLWPVEDQSTRRVMTAFYRLRRAGNTKADALRAAQLALLGRPAAGEVLVARRSAVPVRDLAANRPPATSRWAHPYHWAPFVLAGDAR